MNPDLLNILPKVRGRYTPMANIAKTIWFRTGGPAEVLFKPADMQDLAFFLQAKPMEVPVTTLGVGSNLLVRDAGIPGVVIRLGKNFANFAIKDEIIDVGAGVLDRSLAMMASEAGLSGLEFLVGVPGTIGGALRMNAGCYGAEVKDHLTHAFALDARGKLQTLTLEDMGFSYRHCQIPDDWIFIGARFKAKKSYPQSIKDYMTQLLEKREATQPIRTRTGGSTFANPEGHSAWQLIDAAGCRGLRRGGAQISEQHCNFMINVDHASAHDLEMLGEDVRTRVLNTSGISLRWEIKRIGVASLLTATTDTNYDKGQKVA